MHVKIIDKYLCKVDGAHHYIWNEVRACDRHINLLECYINQLKPWQWLKVQYTNDPSIVKWVLPYKFEISEEEPRFNPYTSYLAYDSEINDVYCLARSYVVLEIIDILDAYEKYGMIPYIRNVPFDELPIEVQDALIEIYSHPNETLYQRYYPNECKQRKQRKIKPVPKCCGFGCRWNVSFLEK